MNTKSCFAPAHILLPSEQIPLEKVGLHCLRSVHQ